MIACAVVLVGKGSPIQLFMAAGQALIKHWRFPRKYDGEMQYQSMHVFVTLGCYSGNHYIMSQRTQALTTQRYNQGLIFFKIRSELALWCLLVRALLSSKAWQVASAWRLVRNYTRHSNDPFKVRSRNRDTRSVRRCWYS